MTEKKTRNTNAAPGKTTKTTNATKTKTTNKAKPRSTKSAPQNVDLWQMIAERAYYKAEQRRFSAGDPVADWLEAEKEVTKKFAA